MELIDLKDFKLGISKMGIVSNFNFLPDGCVTININLKGIKFKEINDLINFLYDSSLTYFPISDWRSKSNIFITGNSPELKIEYSKWESFPGYGGGVSNNTRTYQRPRKNNYSKPFKYEEMLETVKRGGCYVYNGGSKSEIDLKIDGLFDQQKIEKKEISKLNKILSKEMISNGIAKEVKEILSPNGFAAYYKIDGWIIKIKKYSGFILTGQASEFTFYIFATSKDGKDTFYFINNIEWEQIKTIPDEKISFLRGYLARNKKVIN